MGRGWPMTCHCTRLNDDSRSWLTRQHTHAPKKALPERTGCRVTNLAIRMSEHSIIKFHVCSKQVQKDSSPEDEEEEQASPLREDHRTLLLAPRCGPRWR